MAISAQRRGRGESPPPVFCEIQGAGEQAARGLAPRAACGLHAGPSYVRGLVERPFGREAILRAALGVRKRAGVYSPWDHNAVAVAVAVHLCTVRGMIACGRLWSGTFGADLRLCCVYTSHLFSYSRRR